MTGQQRQPPAGKELPHAEHRGAGKYDVWSRQGEMVADNVTGDEARALVVQLKGEQPQDQTMEEPVSKNQPEPDNRLELVEVECVVNRTIFTHEEDEGGARRVDPTKGKCEDDEDATTIVKAPREMVRNWVKQGAITLQV